MTTATLARLRPRVRAIEMPQINWKTICFLSFGICMVLLFFYVWQINALTKGSYLITSYEKQISKLTQENKNLQVSFAERSFWGQALQKMQALNFQKVGNVTYIQILDNSVATATKKTAE